MREEQIFAKTLEELSALAKEQGNMLSEEQVTEAFDKAKLNLGEPQLEMIFAYLKNKKIGIGQPADPFDYMTREEIDYLEEYLKAVQAGADVTDASEKKTGEKLAENANDILEKAEELSKELGRKVTVEELSEETGISEEKIRDAARITADHIEFLESEG